MKIIDIINKMNKLANPKLAMNWDNVGLQIGDQNWEVKKILLALDATKAVIDYAIKIKANLIITHHPFIFKGIKNVTDTKIIKLIENKIGVFTAHTNLDIAQSGVNETLADILDLNHLEALSPESVSKWMKLEVFVPTENKTVLIKELSKAGAGKIQTYNNCAFSSTGTGSFRPSDESNPAIGQSGKLEKVNETKIEMFFDSINQHEIIKCIYTNHPYEAPVFSIIETKQASPNFGLGVIGDLPNEMELMEFVNFTKRQLNAPSLKVWTAGKEKIKVKKVAVCGGSGSSLIKKAINKADVFVSADFTYHTISDSKIPLIDADHFYTEYPILAKLKEKLTSTNLEIINFPKEKYEYTNQLIYK